MSRYSLADVFSKSIEVKVNLLKDPVLDALFSEIVTDCIETLGNGGKILFCGNGGSFADAQHLAAEFTSRFLFDRDPLAAIALGTNSSAMSAMGNDYGYEKVFSREVTAVAHSTDVMIALSTSGNSPNILEAVRCATKKGLKVYGFTGESGGALAEAVRCVRVPSSDTARIQECHITIGHALCEIIEAEIFSDH